MKRLSKPAVQVGLIGCGEVTRWKHLPALTYVPEVKVAALCDLDIRRSRALAAKFGVPQSCAAASEIFALPEVDAVAICTDPASHADLAIAALRAGKHVLVEKPLALTTADCQRMTAAADAASLVAMTGFHMRFHRLIREALREIVAGALGPIRSVRMVWHSPRTDRDIPSWKTRRESGGGASVEIAVHHFDLLRFLLDTDFAQVYALSRDGLRQDEEQVVVGRLASQALFSAEFSERSPHEIEIVVSGRDALMRVNCERFDGLEIRRNGELTGAPVVRLRSVRRFFQTLPMGLKTLNRGGDYRMSYENLWRHFAACVRDGRRPELTFQDGLRAQEVVCAALRSAAISQPVDLPGIRQLKEAR